MQWPQIFSRKTLDENQLQQLADDGYTVLPRAVPEELRGWALRSINHYIGSVDMSKEGRANDFFKPLTTAESILDLYRKTDIPAFAQSLIGRKKLAKIEYAQIALRFPMSLEEPAHVQQEWHVDNIVRSNGGSFGWGLSNFSLLVGVFLSDVSKPGRGNFTVRPGGHRIMAEYFRKHGIEGAKDAHRKVELPPPRELYLNAGDVALVHHLLPHVGGANTSPDIRYACFFRLYTEGRGYWLPEALGDLFLEWEGVPPQLRESEQY